MVIVVIRLRNLSNEAHAPHIRDFFKGLVIPEGGVQIIGGEDGTAFIIFGSDEDARQAMMRDGKYLCDKAVKLTLSSKAEMNKIIEDSQGEPSTQSVDGSTQGSVAEPVAPEVNAPAPTYPVDPYATKPRLPYEQPLLESEHEKYVEVIFAAGQLQEHDFRNFFLNLNIVYITFHPGPDERYQSAIIKFSARHEQVEALKKDGSVIGIVPVKIMVLDEAYCKKLEAYYASIQKPKVEFPPEAARTAYEIAPAPAAPRELSVEVYGIPSSATFDVVGDFFALPRVIIEEFLFLEMMDGICKGRAYIDFGTNHYEYTKILQRDRSPLMNSPLTIRSIPFRDMVEVFRLNRNFCNRMDYLRTMEARKAEEAFYRRESQAKKHKPAYQHKMKPEEVVALQKTGKNGDSSENKNSEANKKSDSGSDNEEIKPPGEEDAIVAEPAPKDTPKDQSDASKHTDGASESKNNHSKPQQQNKRKFCVRLANVAYHATDEDIRGFFRGIPIPPNGITILSKGVKKTGHVFVRFTCAEHAHEAEKLHEKDFLGRSVLVKTSYVQYLKTIWERVIGPGFPDDKFNEDSPEEVTSRPKSVVETFFDQIHHYKMNCLHVRNLPSSTLESDVYSILKRENVRVRRIDVLKDHTGRCKGDAYVELEAVEDCFQAVKIHEKVLFFGQPLQFFPITIAQLQKDLDIYLAPKYPDYARHDYPAARAEPKPADPYYAAANAPYNPYEKRARVEPAPVSYPPPVAAAPLPAATSPEDPLSAEYARKYNYMVPPTAEYRLPPAAEGAPAVPSLAVKMSNLSSDVTQEDIMEFFAQFNPIPKSVRLVYDDKGRLTGQGVLTFPAPEAAKAAVEKLNGQIFLQRPIKLELD